MKTEPETFSIDDLRRKRVEAWDGVRNFQARNFMMAMQVGDLVLIHHSGKEPGIAGVAKVASAAQPDPTQFDPKSHYFDRRATKAKPVWFCPKVRFVKKFEEPLLLRNLKKDPKLKGMRLLSVGRLSVQPVSKEHFAHITSLAA